MHIQRWIELYFWNKLFYVTWCFMCIWETIKDCLNQIIFHQLSKICHTNMTLCMGYSTKYITYIYWLLAFQYFKY